MCYTDKTDRIHMNENTFLKMHKQSRKINF